MVCDDKFDDHMIKPLQKEENGMNNSEGKPICLGLGMFPNPSVCRCLALVKLSRLKLARVLNFRVLQFENRRETESVYCGENIFASSFCG